MPPFNDPDICRDILDGLEIGVSVLESTEKNCLLEFSTDRTHAARRLMQANGVGANQRTQVRGFAGQRLRKIDTPLDPSNRRISIIVHYIHQEQ
jgi:hypothetical protein